MGLDAQKALQLSALLSQMSMQWTGGNPGQNAFAEQLLGSAQAGIQAEALKKARKEQEKKEKGAFGGKLGSLLGSAAGIALAPATGGASLALAGAAGGALGGAAGTALAGGSPSGISMMGNAAEGGMAGYSAYKQGQLAEAVLDAPVQRPLAETVERDLQGAIKAAGQSAVPGSRLQLIDPIADFTPPKTTPRPGFGKRFGNALGHVMDQQQTSSAYRIRRQPSGTPDIYTEY